MDVLPPKAVPAELTEMEVDTAEDGAEEDLYAKLKTLQRQLEFLEIQEEYIKTEQTNLKRELLRAQVNPGLL